MSVLAEFQCVSDTFVHFRAGFGNIKLKNCRPRSALNVAQGQINQEVRKLMLRFRKIVTVKAQAKTFKTGPFKLDTHSSSGP